MAVFSKDNMIVAWANIYASNNSVRDSYNVSSLTNDGSGKQMVYLNRSMIGKRLSVVGCVNKNLCEVLTFQLK